MNYNYKEAITTDIINFINANKEEFTDILNQNDENKIYDELFDMLYNEDYITGNESGSYTFDSQTAAEYICNNLSYFAEACEEYDYSAESIISILNFNETIDVTIRCYLFGECLDKAIKILKSKEN